MATGDRVKKALSPKSDKERRKLHSHAVRYERAENGGFHAHVERHTGDGQHHHNEHHVLPDKEAADAHFDEHMGDQPAAGEGSPMQEVPPSPGPEMAAGGAGGGGAMPPEEGAAA